MENALLVFDPMNHQMKVVEAALKRGLSVIAITTIPLVSDLPYGACINQIKTFIKVDSWLNKDALEQAFFKLQKDFNIVATYSAMEIVLPFEAWVRERLNLPTNSCELITSLLNKRKVRQLLLNGNLSALKIYNQEEVRNWQDWPENFHGYFKPCSGSGSAHVVECNKFEDLQLALISWDKREEVSFSLVKDLIYGQNEFFIEQGAKGQLLSVESLVYQGRVSVFGLTSRTLLAANPVMEMGTQFPYKHAYHEKIVDKIVKIHKHLNITHGVTHAEVIVDDEGTIELVELNLRFAGGDVLVSVNLAYGIEMEQILLDLAMGREPFANFDILSYRFTSAQYLLAPKNVEKFESISFPDESVFCRTIFPIGNSIPPGASQSGWLGGFILVDDNYSRLLDRSNDLRKEVIVNGIRLGNDENNRVVYY